MTSKILKIIIKVTLVCIVVLIAIFGNYLYRRSPSEALIGLSRKGAVALLLASFLITGIITINTNRKFTKLGDNTHVRFAAILNILLAILIGFGILGFGLCFCKVDILKSTGIQQIHILNWSAAMVAFFVLMIDLLIAKGTESESDNAKGKRTHILMIQILSYIDIPVFIGIVIACLAGTLMAIYPLDSEIESYINGFTAGAITMQITVANISFAIIAG